MAKKQVLEQMLTERKQKAPKIRDLSTNFLKSLSRAEITNPYKNGNPCVKLTFNDGKQVRTCLDFDVPGEPGDLLRLSSLKVKVIDDFECITGKVK